jgi:hypothetical protein
MTCGTSTSCLLKMGARWAYWLNGSSLRASDAWLGDRSGVLGTSRQAAHKKYGRPERRVNVVIKSDRGITNVRESSANQGQQWGGEKSDNRANPVDWRAAEVKVAGWLVERGERGVAVTPSSHDLGIDVNTDGLVVQVNHWKGNVGAPHVRQIVGAAMPSGKQPVLFTRSGFTRDALEFAEQAGVGLFTYDELGGLSPVSSVARRIF